MTPLETGLIYDATGRPDAERITFFTALCPLASGTVMAGCQIGPAKHAPTATLRLFRSHDAGSSWEELSWRFETTLDGIPGSLAAAEMAEAEPGRLLLFTTWFDRSDPERPLFDPITEGILPARQLMAISTDEGTTWSPWRVLPTPGLTGCAVTGPPVRWDDGAIAFAFESFKEHDDPNPGRHAAWLLVTRDGGRTFEAPFLVAQHPRHTIYYWDQRVCPAAQSGDFIALFWTHDLVQKKDLRVHFLHASLNDGERAAASPVETTIPGQIAAPLLLPDGRIFAFVVDRDRPGTLCLWQSDDDGHTWPEHRRMTIHTHDEQARLSQGRENVDFRQYWEDMGKWTFGHPALRQLPDGRLLLAYYAGTPDRMSLHWARCDP